MKKSNKKTNIEPPITPDQILEDFDKMMSFVNKIENSDLLSMNLDDLDKESLKIKKEMEEKYNPIIDKLKKNLDSEK